MIFFQINRTTLINDILNNFDLEKQYFFKKIIPNFCLSGIHYVFSQNLGYIAGF